MEPRNIPLGEISVQQLQNNNELTLAYLNQVFSTEVQQDCLLALRRVAEAHGSMNELAGQTALNVKSLYHALSPKGNPTFKSLLALCQALGLQLAFVARPTQAQAHK